MAEGLVRKKRIRAGHRGSTTRMLREVDELLAADTLDKARLAQLKLSLQEKLDTLKQIDGEILELTEEGDLENEIQQADTFKDSVYSAMVRLQEAVKETVTATPPTSVAAMPHTPDHRIKLPKLTIQSFDRDVTLWTPFWDSYDSAIHQNPSLSEVDRFNYLRSLLRGTAREAVSGLMLTTANYQEAIDILKRRFGNKQQIISRHMDILMTTEAVTSHNNVKALRRLYDVMESKVRSLKSLGVTAESYGSLLASVLMNKLPSELRLIISRKIGDDDWDLTVILQELLTEIEARERTATTGSMIPSSQGKKSPRRQQSQSTTTTLHSSSSSPQCSFCGQVHVSESCTTIRGPEEGKHALMAVSCA